MAQKKLNLSGHENAYLSEMGFKFPGALHVDLADSELGNKIVAFLRDTCELSSGDTVVVALPGLSPLAVMVVAALHGFTGHFPVIVPLVRSDEGFVPGQPFNLQDYRNKVARVERKNVVEL